MMWQYFIRRWLFERRAALVLVMTACSVIFPGLVLAQPAGPRPLISALSVSGEREPISGAVKIAPFEIVVYAQGPTERSKIYRQGDLVGAVAGPGTSGFVYISTYDTSLASASIITVPLEIRGLTAAGTYEGQVDVTNNGIETDAVKLTVTVTDQSPKAARPLITDLSISGAHSPFSPQVIYSPIVVPIAEPASGLEVTDTAVLVGVVTGPGQLGGVYRVPCSQLPAVVELTGTVPVCLDIRGLNAPGTYTGQIDVAGTGDEKNVVTLTAIVSDGIGWAMLASAAGVLIAACVLWLGGGLAPYLNLSERARSIQEEIAALNAEQELARRRYTIKPDAHFETFWSDFHRYSARLIWDTTSDDYKALVKLLDDAEADSDRFKNELGPALARLAAGQDQFLAFLSTDPLGLGAQASPPLTEVVAQHLVGTPLPIGKLQPRLDTWQALVDLMQTWMDMTASIKRYTNWAAQLLPKITDAKDKDSLAYVEAKLTETRHELYDVAITQDLTTLRTQKELDDVYRLLAQLGSRYVVWVPVVSPATLTKGVAMPAINLFAVWSLPRNPILEPEKASPALLAGMRWVTDLVLALFALGVAVFTGLQANYFGKVFGAPQDYFSMLLLGGGAQAAVTGLVAVAERLLKRSG